MRKLQSKTRAKPGRRVRIRNPGRRGGGAARGAAGFFPRLSRQGPVFGVGVLFAVAESRGATQTIRVVRREAFSRRAGGRNRVGLLESVDGGRLAQVLAGIGQRHRVGVLRAILAGGNTHAALTKATGLAPGPLYHHLRSLERAGLVTFVERNRYDVSRLGRDLILLVTVAIGDAASRGRGSKAKSNVP